MKRLLFSPVFILFIGLLFRLAELPYVRHGFDESYPMYDALRLLDGHQWIWIGQPSSIFLNNPPLMAYLQAIPLLFWRSPWAVYLFVTVLNSLATWFVYQTAHSTLGRTVAIIAAFLFAINPWVVEYSRLPWTQGLLPLFMAVMAWGLLPTLTGVNARPVHFLGGLLALILATQTYILSFVLLIPVGILLWLFRQAVPRQMLWVGLIVFSVGLGLFSIGLRNNAAQNSAKWQEFVSHYRPQLNGQALSHTARFVTGQDYYGQDLFSSELATPQWPTQLIATGLGLSLVVGIGRGLWSWPQNRNQGRLTIALLVWLGVPLGLFLFFPYTVHPHYLLLTLPALHLFAAWGMSPIFESKQFRWIGFLLILLIAGQFKLNLFRAGQAIAQNPVPAGFNGWTLSEAARLGGVIQELTREGETPQRLFAPESSAVLSGMSGVWVETFPELIPPEFVIVPAHTPFPYLIRHSHSNPPFTSPFLLPQRILQLADGSHLTVFQTSAANSQLSITSINWDTNAGLTFKGYTLTPPSPIYSGDKLLLTTFWHVKTLLPERDQWYISPFYHLLTPQGEIALNLSGHGQWGHRWQIEDTYIEQIYLSIPTNLPVGEYQIRLGLFDPIHSLNFPFNSPIGQTNFHLIPISLNLP